MSKWETIIGLEIHVQLNTKSKLFSTAANRFGNEPNTNITVVCTGQPGALPVINFEAVKKAVQFGCAIGAKIDLCSLFDRKSYFYPDSPRNFQITQFYRPIMVGGSIITDVEGEPKTFSIEHAHLEDDAGMLKHFSNFAGVDYNRAGAPLLEIVSDPCIHSPKEAVAYAKAIKAVMEYLDASDCNMEEGSLRCDVNISVRPAGETTLRTKTEIKNMNSFAAIELAAVAEVKRQIREYERGGTVEQATYRWDPDKKQITLMRKKEHAHDYRYCPEPDLPPLVLTQKLVDDIRSALPELPYQRTKRYVEQLGLTEYAASLLTIDKKIADYFEEALQISHHPRHVCNWITGEFAGRLKESGKTLLEVGIPPKDVAQLVNFILDGTITGKLAKDLADEMLKKPGTSPRDIIALNPHLYQPVATSDALEQIIEKVLTEQQQSVEDFKAGKERAFGFLVGQVMKATQGKASPALVNEMLKEKLK
ncbi:MAG: Asp-tRNA(Asn)/Glu-tRNA(Gln) amidotransferase subunit GatB [Verrucomicrobia bacterium]|nr:Asp-tRNA(Asn)/Glu-tRNA(Gln) amidotransferase subunit GatB [Verrucomicrobiota bacterium]